MAVWFSVAIYCIGMLFNAYRHTVEPQERQILGLILFSNIIAYAGGSTNYFLWFDIQILPWGNIFVSLYAATIAYAILAHQLFDIKVIIRKTILFTGLLTVLVSIYAIIIIVSTTMVGGQSRFDFRFLGFDVLATILISIGYEPLNRRLQNFADHFLFRKDFEQQKLLREMSHRLNEVLGLDEALEIIMKGLIGIFSLQHAATYVFQPENHKPLAVKRVRQIGYASATKLMLDEKDFISSFFAERESIVLVEILQRELTDEDFRLRSDKDGELARRHAIKQAVFNKLTVLNVAIAIPLHIKQQLIGLIILGPKISGDPFGESDLSLVDLVSTQIISSIERARLYEGDQMKSEFVSIASHELLTPISAMEGYLSMILDEHMGETDEKARGYLENVYASTKRLSSLVKDMLLASKLEAGQLKINPAKLDLNKLVADTLIQLKKTAKEKKLALTFDEPKKLIPPVLADPERTAQILTNLIGNSIKYTFSGSVAVKLNFQEADGTVRVDIIDTGAGMPKEQQAHLFEKFYRVYSLDTADIPGTGLGLYITKSLVEKMGGTISVASEPKVGSTFSFTLPIFRV